MSVQSSRRVALIASALVAGISEDAIIIEPRRRAPLLTPPVKQTIRREPRSSKPRKKRTPHSATDGLRLRKAELKRRRKAAQRNTDRAVIIGGDA